MRRGRQDLDHIGFGKIAVIAEYPRPDPFAWQGERDHHHPSSRASYLWFAFIRLAGALIGWRRFGRGGVGQEDPAQAGAEVGQGADLQFDLLVIGEWLVVELFLLTHGTDRTRGAAAPQSEPHPDFSRGWRG